jgi:hypothetical protein
MRQTNQGPTKKASPARVRKLLNFYRQGFLPEEEAEPAAWPWSVPAAKPKRPSRCANTAADRLDRQSQGLTALSAIENQIATSTRDASDEANLRLLSERVANWFRTHCSPEGFLIDDPWRTYQLLPALDRLRVILTPRHWTSEMDGNLDQAFAAVLRSTPAGTRSGLSSVSLSSEYMQLLCRLANERGRRKWRNVVLWLTGQAGRPMREPPPNPGTVSTTAQVAVLRRDWSRQSAVVRIDFRQTEMLLELYLLGQPVLYGLWQIELDEIVSTTSPATHWSLSCWYADEDGEYLELSRILTNTARVDRQIYLARRARLLWLADSVRRSASSAHEIRWRLRVPEDVSLRGDLTTRAQTVVGVAAPVRIIPIAQPADPFAASNGRITVDQGVLHVSAFHHQKTSFLPLAITWGRDLSTAQEPWRQLSVTSSRRLLGSAEAVAYRLPLTGCQFVYFRAFEQLGRFAFLGHQTRKECVIGDLTANGRLEEWVGIEPLTRGH